MAIKITDLVDPNEIDKLKQLDAELAKVLDTYTKVAKDIAKGLEINVSVVGDIDKLEKVLVDKGKEAANVQQQLVHVMEEKNKVIADTTNTISRQLMEQERVNKAQREAYTENDRVKKLLDRFHDTYENQAESLARLKTKLDANKKAQQENEKALSLGQISMSRYLARQADLIVQQRDLAQQKKSLTQLMTAEEKAAQTAEGSYAHMSQQLELLKKAYKGLGEESLNSDYGKELEETIQNLDAHLKDMAADMGEFQRNVGNYAVANSDLKKKYEELVGTLASLQSQYEKMSEAEKAGEAGKKLASGIEEVSNAAKETKKTLDEQAKAVENARKSLEGSSGTNASVRRDLKELVLEIANLSIEYQNLSEEEKNSAEGQALAEHIRDLTEKAGVLKDAISDTNAAITNAASDTRTFDQLGGSLQLAVDGFGLAQSAAAMLGISEGELAEIQTKLMAAITASNAVTKIQNTLQKQSAVMQGVANLQTKAGTIAIKLKTAAEGKGVVTTKLLTAAQWLFNKAASANPIGLLVVAIMACIASVSGLIKVFNVFGRESEKRKEQLKLEEKALDNLGKAHNQNIELLKAMGKSEAEVIASSIDGLKKLKDAWASHYYNVAKLYDEDSEEYKRALEKKGASEEEFLDGLKGANKFLMKMFSEEGEKQLEEQAENMGGLYKYKVGKINEEKEHWKDLYKTIHTLDGTWTETGQATFDERMDSIAQRRIKELDKEEEQKAEETRKKQQDAYKKQQEEYKKAAEALKKEVQAGEDAMLKLITDSLERQRQAEELSYNRKLKELQDRLAKTKETEVKLRTALNQQIEGLTAEHTNKMQELEFAGNERRLKAEADLISSRLAIIKDGSAEELELRQKQLGNQYNTELLSIQKSENEKNITVEQAEELRLNLEKKYQKLREEAVEKHAEKEIKTIEKKYADEQANRDNAYISELNALKMKYAKELAEAKGNTGKQKKIRERFEEEQAKLSERYARETAQASIDMLEEVLKNEKLSAEDRLKYEQALAKAKIDLITAVADANERESDKTVEDDNKATEKRIENAKKWLQVAADSLNTINDLVSTVYDAKIQKVEEEQEANTAAGEAEQERIAELVEKNVITEEEGEARKRAAEAQTAKKNEELEKKKQQLKHKQAVWDKANSIAQATISTSLAIMNMLKSSPWPMNIAMAAVAGAMGAVQIATILATPIPKYAKGTDKHKGGPAIVGDGGVPELVMFGDKSWITPDTPTIVDLPAGAIVKPTIDGTDDGLPGLTPLPAPGNNNSPVIINNDYKRLEEKMDMFINVMRRHSNRQYQNSIENSINRFASERV